MKISFSVAVSMVTLHRLWTSSREMMLASGWELYHTVPKLANSSSCVVIGYPPLVITLGCCFAGLVFVRKNGLLKMHTVEGLYNKIHMYGIVAYVCANSVPWMYCA